MELPHPHDTGPRHRAPERPRAQDDADTLTEHALERTTSYASRRRITSLYAIYGAPFAAYLTLPDTNLDTVTLDANFTDTYHATFPNAEALVAAHLDAMGWTDALAEFRRTWAIPDGLLTWNSGAAYRGITTHLYDVIEAGGALHAFAR